MQTRQMQWHRLIACTFILLMAAGCFQAAGDANLQATDAAAQQAPTFTPIPSNTPVPTEPPPSDTPAPQPTNTPEDNFTGGASSDNGDAADLLLTSSFNPPVTIEIAQAATPDAIALTVTAIYQNAINQQQQQQQQPEVPAQQPIDPIAMTATYIVGRATQTAAAPLTQTAIALFGQPAATQAPAVDIQQPQQPVQPGATLVPGTDCVHEVRATDRNLYRIALNYGVTTDSIARASGIVNPDLILVGQRLTIPGCGVTGARPLPTSTPEAGATAVVGATAVTNGGLAVPAMTFTPIPGQVVQQSANPGTTTTTTGGGQIHVVQQGETLFQLSMQYGVLVNDIAAANGISNINVIYIGQELVIP
jgi:LysM repeat protein